MDKQKLLADVLETLKRHHIFTDDSSVKLIHSDIMGQDLSTTIEFRESYHTKRLIISFDYRQIAPLLTSEDELVFCNSIHPFTPNMRKHTDHITGETEITIDGIPVKKKRRGFFSRLFKKW